MHIFLALPNGIPSHDTFGRVFAALDPVAFEHCFSRQCLDQVATTDKSNEITAIPVLLETLRLDGALITIDAMGCQIAIARQIVAAGGDYMLASRTMQPTLKDNAANAA